MGLAAAAALVGSVGACAPNYPVHPPMDLPRGATRTMGCVELSVGAGRDADFPSTSLLVEVGLHNRCDEPALVDLRALRMWSEQRDGERWQMAFYDPRGEIVPLHLEAQATGLERFRVDGAGAPGTLRQACFDPTYVGGPTTHLAGAVCYLFDHELSGGEGEPSQ